MSKVEMGLHTRVTIIFCNLIKMSAQGAQSTPLLSLSSHPESASELWMKLFLFPVTLFCLIFPLTLCDLVASFFLLLFLYYIFLEMNKKLFDLLSESFVTVNYAFQIAI